MDTMVNHGSLGDELRRTLGQIVLVLQGGGALGAYQVGVYQALHEAGVEPDWVTGTSIGAIVILAEAATAAEPGEAALHDRGQQPARLGPNHRQ